MHELASPCLGCECKAPAPLVGGGRLLLATRLDHTAATLRSLATRNGFAVTRLAPGLLDVDAPEPAAFISQASAVLSSVEAEEVRCLITARGTSDDGLLIEAMLAPTLAIAGARSLNVELASLLDTEATSFHSVYQPIVTLRSRQGVGYEALLRATAPDGKAIMPDVLFPAAEAAGWTGLLDRIGRTTALRHAGPWLAPDDLLFINFVPTSIYRPEVCLRTTEIAAEQAGVNLGQLVFEVSETQQVRDLDHLQRVFDYYRSRDCKVALDDLGSGYSSLNLLVRLQPDVVKLDKELVQSLPGAAGEATVRAVVDITHSYGGLVLAECVETEEQAEISLELGVDLGQGWLFGRPEAPRALAKPVIVGSQVCRRTESSGIVLCS